jgi:hypothetical protein
VASATQQPATPATDVYVVVVVVVVVIVVVIVIVIVDVIAPVIVAALVNGNANVGVIDARERRISGGTPTMTRARGAELLSGSWRC